MGETKVQRQNFSQPSERIIQNLPESFSEFFETLKNCIEPFSERVHNYYCLRVLTIFNQSFILHSSFVSQY